MQYCNQTKVMFISLLTQQSKSGKLKNAHDVDGPQAKKMRVNTLVIKHDILIKNRFHCNEN